MESCCGGLIIAESVARWCIGMRNYWTTITTSVFMLAPGMGGGGPPLLWHWMVGWKGAMPKSSHHRRLARCQVKGKKEWLAPFWLGVWTSPFPVERQVSTTWSLGPFAEEHLRTQA